MTDYTDFLHSYRRERAVAATANALNKAVVFDALTAAGVTHLAVTFDGEGDSGQLEDIRPLAGERPVPLPSTSLTTHAAAHNGETLTTREQTLREAVEDLCYEFLEEKRWGWENNDGAYGEFRFDVASRTIHLEFNARYTDVNTDIYEL